MKNLLSVLFIFSTLFYLGCSDCGKNIDLGEYELMPESVQNWTPYEDIEQLNFQNSSGQILSLTRTHYEKQLQQWVTKWLCENNVFDKSYEFADFEEVFIAFEGTLNNVFHSLSIHLAVGHNNYDSGGIDDHLYDRVSYDLQFRHEGSDLNSAQGIITSETLIILAHNRGNNINESGYDNMNFLEEVTLNEQIFKNVWYSDDDLNIPLHKNNNPILYVQNQKGLIGFVDNDLVTWVIAK